MLVCGPDAGAIGGIKLGLLEQERYLVYLRLVVFPLYHIVERGEVAAYYFVVGSVSAHFIVADGIAQTQKKLKPYDFSFSVTPVGLEPTTQ